MKITVDVIVGILLSVCLKDTRAENASFTNTITTKKTNEGKDYEVKCEMTYTGQIMPGSLAVAIFHKTTGEFDTEFKYSDGQDLVYQTYKFEGNKLAATSTDCTERFGTDAANLGLTGDNFDAEKVTLTIPKTKYAGKTVVHFRCVWSYYRHGATLGVDKEIFHHSTASLEADAEDTEFKDEKEDTDPPIIKTTPAPASTAPPTIEDITGTDDFESTTTGSAVKADNSVALVVLMFAVVTLLN